MLFAGQTYHKLLVLLLQRIDFLIHFVDIGGFAKDIVQVLYLFLNILIVDSLAKHLDDSLDFFTFRL